MSGQPPTGPWTLCLETDPDPALRAHILAPLVAYNESVAPDGNWGLLAVTVRDPDGAVVGGLWGRTGYGMLFVELLALGPARGEGLGRRVMALAEEEARRRGLSGIWLDTWTFRRPASMSGSGSPNAAGSRTIRPVTTGFSTSNGSEARD